MAAATSNETTVEFVPTDMQVMIHSTILPDLEALPGLIAATTAKATSGPTKAEATKAIAASTDPKVIAAREQIAEVTKALAALFTETAQSVLPDYSASSTVDTEERNAAKAEAKAVYARIEQGLTFGESYQPGFRAWIGDIPKPAGVHASVANGDGPKRPRLAVALIDGENVKDPTYTAIMAALKAKGISTTTARLHALARTAADVADISDVTSAEFAVVDGDKSATVSVTHKVKD